MMLRQAFILFVTLRFSNIVGASRTYRASFVPPASPRLTSSHAPTTAVSTGYGLCSTDTTTLFAKKKAVAAAPKKIQVKLLKHIAGTGQAGEVILVTPAFFNNKLRPTKSAEIISDEQVEKERAESKARQAALNAAANEIVGTPCRILFCRFDEKAARTDNSSEGIGPKVVMEELSKQLPNALWE
jgi:hypothetical protein